MMPRAVREPPSLSASFATPAADSNDREEIAHLTPHLSITQIAERSVRQVHVSRELRRNTSTQVPATTAQRDRQTLRVLTNRQARREHSLRQE